MMKKSVSLLASVLLLLPLLTLAAEPRKTLAPKSIDSKKNLPNSVETKNTVKGSLIPGGYTPIENVKTPFIQHLGKFAVDEHNKQKGDHLKFLEVYAGQIQIVAGRNYKLQIRTAIDALRFNYEAVIFEDLKGIIHLKSFVEIIVPGGYYRIKDIKTPMIQDLGKFAVDDHNIQKRVNLQFRKVYEGASQAVAGTNYKLLLWATDGNKLGKYLTVVSVNLKQIPQLTSFEEIE